MEAVNKSLITMVLWAIVGIVVEQEVDTRRYISDVMMRGVGIETRKGFHFTRLRHHKLGVRGGTAKLLYRGLFSLAMKVSSRSRNLAFSTLLLIVLLLATSCTCNSKQAARSTRVLPRVAGPVGDAAFGDESCGVLYVRRPLFNVTGWLTAAVRSNTSVSVLIAPSTSLESVLWTVQNCPPLGKVPVVNGRFSVPYLPVGKYLVALPMGSFGDVQGFPIVDEFNTSSHSVRVLWHGGDPRHSICAFAVEERNLSGERSLS